MSKIGVDLSVYQSNTNYDEAVLSIDFAILRVGYGVSYLPDSQRDTEFDNHYWGFKGKIPLGAYYYAYGVDYETGRKEAENCLAYMGDKQFEMPIFYDMEESRNTKEAGQGFVDRIREAGLKAGIYASSYFYDNKGLYNINCDSVWIAEYGRNDGEMPSEKPSTPCNIWQYTSKGYVPGIGSDIDMDVILDGMPVPEPHPTPEPSGDDTIRDIQNWLNNNYGTGIAVDGYYGPKTKEALVKALQTELNRQYDKSLKVDGIVGPKTKEAFDGVQVCEGDEGNITHTIQAMLHCLGYDTNGVEGIFGSGTDEAVRQFQKNNKLKVDGIVGPNTLTALFE